MKEIKTLHDIDIIIKQKLDVTDPFGHTVPYERLLGSTLLVILNDVLKNGWTYQHEQ